ncbi:MAG: hypothetical protein ACKO6N_07840 [Myxococcota bacterium]
MWKLLRSFFCRALTNAWKQIKSSSSDEPQSDLQAIKAEVENILKLDLSSEAARESNRDLVLYVLRRLDGEVEDVRQQANGYPANPISALVWMNGAGYGNLACALTLHFRDAGWLKCEEKASALWVKAILSVCSHYHHLVGPAMLANADCHDRLGNAERATKMYGAIVMDFACIANIWRDESEPPSDEDRIALESLQTANERLLSRGITDLDGIDLAALQSQVQDVLSRPVPDE